MANGYAKYAAMKSALYTATIASAVALLTPAPGNAQESALEEVIVTGIRGSLQRAQDIKHDAVGVVDAIAAEDLGKFPDLDVAESLQRVTGVAIDRIGGAYRWRPGQTISNYAGDTDPAEVSVSLQIIPNCCRALTIPRQGIGLGVHKL